MKATHICYSDESNWNNGRFRSVCMISLPLEHVDELETKILEKLKESNVDEFKWGNLHSGKYRFAAVKLIDLVFDFVDRKILRLDTIIWDILDSRHAVEGRDDLANLGRMYFHLLNNVLKERWPDDAVWFLCPDEHNNIDWNTLHEVLDYKSVMLREHDLFTTSGNLAPFVRLLKKVYHVGQIEPCKSHEKCLVQVSDLFAGLAWFSKEHFTEYQKWSSYDENQLSLLENTEPAKLTNTQRERFHVLRKLIDGCGKRKLGVSLKSSGALTTPDPKYPINFWWYKPQTEMDKAPKKIL